MSQSMFFGDCLTAVLTELSHDTPDLRAGTAR